QGIDIARQLLRRERGQHRICLRPAIRAQHQLRFIRPMPQPVGQRLGNAHVVSHVRLMSQASRQPKGRVLIVAGSDSGGGAGIQADIKTVTALGGYAATAITAITVQNTLGVTGVHEVPVEIVRAQIEAVMSDIGADAWKLGMLGSAAHVRAVAEAYEAVGNRAAMVLDPVMIAKGGAALLADDAIEVIATELVPRAAIVTPNAPEAEALTGVEVRGLDGEIDAAEALVENLGAHAALIKGGHIEGDIIRDVLLTREGYRVFESARI